MNKKNRKRTPLRLPATTLLCCLMAFLTWSCGKKAVPRPPVQPELPLVQDLRAEVTSDGIALKWTIAAPVNGLVGFNIYRSDPLPQPTDCPACPREYRRIGTVEAKPGDTSFETIDQSLQGAGLFYYSVVPFDEQHRPGPDSNEVQVIARS